MLAILLLGTADLILHNAKVVTVDPTFSIVQAVAVEGNRIAACGTNQQILTRKGPHTKVIDLRGRVVLPGLFDTHVHALSAGLSEYRSPLPALTNYEQIREYIREKARVTPKGQWILVPLTFPTRLREMAMPTRELLDVDQEHPVLFNASYTVVVNSYALRMSGIDRNTPNPPAGEVVKDAHGEPNGILKNAQKLLKGLNPSQAYTEREKLEALEGMLKRYLAAGLTSIEDRAVDATQIGLYRKLRDEGRLPVRAVLCWRIDASRPVEKVVEEVRTAPYAMNAGDDWLRFGAFKVTLDGGMTIGTAYQRQPYGPFGRQLYANTNPDNRGLLFLQPPKLLAIMRAARDRGWALTAHDQGGGAIDAFLDAMESLDREWPIAPSRSHVMHASFQSPEAIERMRRMGIQADVQAQWLYLDGPALEKVFGYDGMRYFYPLRTYLKAGIVLAAGSDHMIGHDKNRAVNPYNPFLSMWIEVTRKTVTGKVLHPEERITRQEALKTHTIWSAWLQTVEKTRGSIEPGKLADMVVTDGDLLTCPEDQIRNIEPVMTVLDGKVAWESVIRSR